MRIPWLVTFRQLGEGTYIDTESTGSTFTVDRRTYDGASSARWRNLSDLQFWCTAFATVRAYAYSLRRSFVAHGR